MATFSNDFLKDVVARAAQSTWELGKEMNIDAKTLIEMKEEDRDWQPMAILITNAGPFFISAIEEEVGDVEDVRIETYPEFFTERSVKMPIFIAHMVDELSHFMGEENVANLLMKALCMGIRQMGEPTPSLEGLAQLLEAASG